MLSNHLKAKLLVTALTLCGSLSMWAGQKHTFNATITRNTANDINTPTVLQANATYVAMQFGYKNEAELATAMSSGSVTFEAKQGSKDTYVNTHTYGIGTWFTAKSVPTSATNTARRIACKYEDKSFKIVHFNDKVVEGDVFSFVQVFVHDGDTVQYNFTVTMGNTDSATSDQPDPANTFIHRADATDSWEVKPHVRRNDQDILYQNYIQVQAGDNITLGAEPIDPDKYKSVTYQWVDRKGKTLRSYKKDDFVIASAEASNSGYYVMKARLTDLNGKVTVQDCYYFVDVQEEPIGTPFSWAGRVPQFSHDWTKDSKYNYGVYQQPTKILGDVAATDRNGKPVNWAEGDWWAVCWGSDLNTTAGAYDSEEVRKCAENMMKKYDEDFAYIRDNMGWPPDLRARNGYKSLVYIFGSGLRNDNTPNTEAGGYQSGIWYSDPKTGISANWPCVWASYYPFSRFRDDADRKWSDGDYQREAMIHEGIHAIFADLDACKGSSWFHEAGNTWLQSAMNTERYNKYGEPGFLDAPPFIAPFMPIECYSGWLLDGSFGGPGAQGVNLYGADGQVCTWRSLLGGTQYGNSFPIVLGEICGKGSIPWIWRNCTDYVLKGIGNYLGEDVMRDLIMQYRARQATFDIGGWKTGYRKVTDNNMGATVKEEYGNGVMTKDDKNSATMPCSQHVEPFKLTPYQTATRNSLDHWLAPDTQTNPGWSGANIIPIHVDSKANKATVEFRPEDTEMRAQLCYVTKAGKNYYSQPVHCGKMTIDLTDRPANNVIFCVVCNTDYIFVNDEKQRKKHWDYRIKFGEGALQVADIYSRWYFNERTITDNTYNEEEARKAADIALDIEDVESASDSYVPGDNGIKLLTSVIMPGMPIKADLNGIDYNDVKVNILGLSGIIEDNGDINPDGTYVMPARLPRGMYFIKYTHGDKCDTYKVYVK